MKRLTEVLLCYRGRFNKYVTALAEELRRRRVRVTYDREILADSSGFDEKAEVGWFSLGDAPQKDTKWRAPLCAAVDSAEMVAFALDFLDTSENVNNEIRWAIQRSAHTFFLMHGGITSPESQGLIIGSLAADYMFTNNRPEYPQFGYHFCGDLDGVDLKEDVVVAANRIMAHLARCREAELPQLTGDNKAKMPDVEQRPEVKGRSFLYRLQEAACHGYTAEGADSRKTPFEDALEYLHGEEIRAARTAQTDRQVDRFRRAEEMLIRSRPGPHELSVYMGPLIVEAASIEAMIQDDLRKERPTLDFRPAVVIGTIIFSELTEPWTVVSGQDYSVLVIDAMFIDFLYQVIKVSVSSAKAMLHDQGSRRTVELDFGAVSEQLRSKPELADGLFRCIRRYVAEGRPDTSTFGSPGLEIQMALGMYMRLAERYLVALGYALISIRGAGWPLPFLDLDFDPANATPMQRRTLLDLMNVSSNPASSGATSYEASLGFRNPNLRRQRNPPRRKPLLLNAQSVSETSLGILHVSRHEHTIRTGCQLGEQEGIQHS